MSQRLRLKTVVLIATQKTKECSTCTICHTATLEMCPKCCEIETVSLSNGNANVTKCSVLTDVCGNGHDYHAHCMNLLAKNDDTLCPMCRTPVKFRQ